VVAAGWQCNGVVLVRFESVALCWYRCSGVWWRFGGVQRLAVDKLLELFEVVVFTPELSAGPTNYEGIQFGVPHFKTSAVEGERTRPATLQEDVAVLALQLLLEAALVNKTLIDETLGVELAVDAVGDLCRRYPPSDSVEHSANCLVRLVVRAMTAFAVLPALFAAFPPFALDKKVFVRFMVMAPHTHYPLAFFLIFIFRTAL